MSICVSFGKAEGAFLPRHLGVNLEIQEDAARCNRWDWLADANVGMARIFHPDHGFRPPGTEGPWNAVADRAGFEVMRAACRRDPQPLAAANAFDFAASRPWLGSPDEIVSRLVAAEVVPLLSAGYSPQTHPRPLLTAPTADPEADQAVNWDAAASAYAYHLGFFHHFAVKHGSARFLLTNEPELIAGHYDHGAQPRPGFAQLVEVMLRDRANLRVAEREAILAPVRAQHRVLGRAARAALEDVAVALGRSDLRLSGPASLRPLDLAGTAAGLVDTFDWHHYTANAGEYRLRWEQCRAVTDAQAMGLSEFNRKSGPTRIEDSYLLHANGIALATTMLEVLSLQRPGDPLYDYALLYCFDHPATHRSFKQLAYGDLDLLDLHGDRVLRDAPERPHFLQRELRHATSAFDIFAALARMTGAGVGRERLAIEAGGLPALACRHESGTELAVVNPGPEAVTLEVPAPLGGRSWSARITDRERRDAVVATGHGAAQVVLPGAGFLHLSWIHGDPETTAVLTLTEHGVSAGRLAALGVLQTTRLAASCAGHDRSQFDVTWTSSHPELVRVGPRGLVQRRCISTQPVTITARTADGRSASLVIPPASEIPP